MSSATPVPLSRQIGNTLVGMAIGFVLALFIAVGVAVYINKSPVPFVGKFEPTNSTQGLKNSAETPDPNRGLYGRNPKTGDRDVPPAVVGGNAVAPSNTPVPTAPEAAPPSDVHYYLQAGAFRDNNEADSLKAKLAMLGVEVQVQPAEVNGNTVYRVRVGPYPRLDDMNRVRARMAASGVEATVIKLKPNGE